MNGSVNNSFRKQLSNFLYEKDLLQLILAVYLGTVLQTFFNSVVQGMIMPLILLLIPNAEYQSFGDIQIKLWGAPIEAGEIIMNAMNLFLGFFISYIFVTRFLRKYLN